MTEVEPDRQTFTLRKCASNTDPEIRVTAITEDVARFILGGRTNQVELGVDPLALDWDSLKAGHIERQVNNILDELRGGNHAYILDWEGNKVPRGVVLEGKKITYTQNGLVKGAEGENIGTYDRIVEFGGESGKKQRMVVYLSPKKSDDDTQGLE